MSPRRAAPAGPAPVRPALVRPELGPQPRTVLPTVTESRLDSGLRVLAVRRAGVPLVEVRLRVPFGGTRPRHLAQATVLAETLFRGTATDDARSLAERLQSLGGALSAGTDADRLVISGSALAAHAQDLLAVLAEVLTTATYPAAEVSAERDRIGHELAIARTQPGVLAAAAVARRRFADHPYGRELPHAEEVAAVTPAQLRTLHATRVDPRDALLVIVGDLTPARAVALAAQTLSGWTGGGRPAAALPAVAPFTPGGTQLVHRPGAVQTCVRVVQPAPARSAPDYPALVLANTVFGGYFSSRLVANIREDKGYTYSPHAGIDHAELASTLVVDADVATDVTAAALTEISYEMGRIATTAATVDELTAARRYVAGTLALSVSSQAGLASTLARLADAGLDISWLRDYPRALATVTPDAAQDAALRWLAPARGATVLVGDADVVAGSVGGLGPVTVASLRDAGL